MKTDEIITQLRADRAELTEGITEQRAIKVAATERIKVLAAELSRCDRLLRAAEGRKKTDGSQ